MTTPFERFLNIRAAMGASFRSDGNRMAFRTDITGVPQVWTLDAPKRWPTQLTFDEDRVVFAEYQPEGSNIAFGRDRGGDENTRVFLISDEGGAPQQLSVVDAKHMWGGWSPDGSQIAWVHNGRNGRDFDIYVYDIETGGERCIQQVEGYWFVLSWMPDGKSLIAGRAESNEHAELYLIGLDGERKRLTPDEFGFFGAGIPSRDGTSVYVTTSLGADFMRVASIDLATLEMTPIHTSTWDVEGLTLSKDGHWLAFIENIDGYSTVYLRDNRSGDVSPLSTERGVVSEMSFVVDTHRVALTLTTPTRSQDIYVIDDEVTERWTVSSMAGINSNDLVTPELAHFESFDGLRVPGLLYLPEQSEGFGVVIDIHGGPEAQRRPGLSAVTQYLVGEGIAVFAPNVRGSSGYGKTYMGLDNCRKRMDSVRDIEAAHAYLVGRGADPSRIALMGGSYGGFMVLSAMVTYPHLWAAGVDIVGVANFVTFLENTSDYRRALREKEYGSLKDDRAFLEEISPANHLDQIAAPLMVIHGRNDPRVPVSEAELVVSGAAENGVEVECIIYDDEGHGLAKRRNRLDAYPRIAQFLKKFVQSE